MIRFRFTLTPMERLLATLEQAGPPAGVQTDPERLRAERRDRATWLARRPQKEPETDWAAVRAGVAHLMPS